MSGQEGVLGLVGTIEVGSDGVEVECWKSGVLGVKWRRTDNGEVHRADGKPAVVDSWGGEAYYENGWAVLGDRPAQISPDGRLVYLDNGGSAVFDSEGEMVGFRIGGGEEHVVAVEFHEDGVDVQKH